MTANRVKMETALLQSGPSFMLLALALFAISPAASTGWDFNRLMPANLMALVACLDLAAFKAMAFKTVVCGGFFLQNRSRFALLIIAALALFCRLSRQTGFTRPAVARLVVARLVAARLVAARPGVASLVESRSGVARPPARRTGKPPALAWRAISDLLAFRQLATSQVAVRA